MYPFGENWQAECVLQKCHRLHGFTLSSPQITFSVFQYSADEWPSLADSVHRAAQPRAADQPDAREQRLHGA